MSDAMQDFTRILQLALGNRLAPQASGFLDMLADDVVMEYPFATPGRPARIEGKAVLLEHLGHMADVISFDRFIEPRVHETTDPELVIAEFEGFGHGVATGQAFHLRSVSFVRTRNGRIVHYRDCFDSLEMMRALRGSAAVDALIDAPTA